MNKSIKYILILVVILTVCFSYLYISKKNYRNKNSVMAHVVNRVWNLNEIDVSYSGGCHIEIFWNLDYQNIKVFDSNTEVSSQIENVYGTNSFTVFINQVKIKSFVFNKANSWFTFDFNFTIDCGKQSVILNTNPVITDMFIE